MNTFAQIKTTKQWGLCDCRICSRLHNPDGQGTLDEILAYYRDHTVYLCNNTDIYVFDDNEEVVVAFEYIGYEDDDCTPDVYEQFDTCIRYADEIADRYQTITKIQGGNN